MMVLDASALLAFLMGETGADRVGEVLGAAAMSTVNLSETFARFVRDGCDATDLARGLREESVVEILDFVEVDAKEAARLVLATKSHGLSFGDRACLALARRLDAPAMTADRVWNDVDCGVEIVCIR